MSLDTVLEGTQQTCAQTVYRCSLVINGVGLVRWTVSSLILNMMCPRTWVNSSPGRWGRDHSPFMRIFLSRNSFVNIVVESKGLSIPMSELTKS